jgi:hypothetical protein
MNNLKVFLSAFLFLLSYSGLAQQSSGPSRKSGFYGMVALKGGMGSFGSGDNTAIEKRSMYRYGGELDLGYRLGSLTFGAAGEYNMWKQSTKPSEVSNTNASGNQIILSPTLGFSFGRFLLRGKYHLSSAMTMDKKSAAGDKVVYSSPTSSYGAQLIMRLSGRAFVGAEYTTTTYKKMKSGSTNEKLNSDTQVNLSGWGVIYGFVF